MSNFYYIGYSKWVITGPFCFHKKHCTVLEQEYRTTVHWNYRTNHGENIKFFKYSMVWSRGTQPNQTFRRSLIMVDKCRMVDISILDFLLLDYSLRIQYCTRTQVLRLVSRALSITCWHGATEFRERWYSTCSSGLSCLFRGEYHLYSWPGALQMRYSTVQYGPSWSLHYSNFTIRTDLAETDNSPGFMVFMLRMNVRTCNSFQTMPSVL